MAVGTGGPKGKRGFAPPLAERWNGTSWSVQPTPRLPFVNGGGFTAISCAATDACSAVGYYQASGIIGAATPGALAERWNGKRWSMEDADKPSIERDSGLTGVSCASRSSCIAVGASVVGYNGYPGKPLAERWNGTDWAITPSASIPRSGGILNGVSCVSSTACTAVGQLNPGAYPTRGGTNRFTTDFLIERWNGTRWAVQHPQNAAGTSSKTWGTGGAGPLDPALAGVSCIAGGVCTAVGERVAERSGNSMLAEGYGWPTPTSGVGIS